MNKVTFPLKLHMRGPKVADLQQALGLFLDRRLLLREDTAARRKLAKKLKAEYEAKYYGKATSKLVSLFQKERQLQSTGIVDKRTAKAINALLEELGLLERPPQEQKIYLVRGRVASPVSAAVDGLRVVVVDKGVGGDAPLAEAKTDAKGRYEVSFGEEAVKRRGKKSPDLQARVYAGEEFLAASAVRYDAGRTETLNVLLDEKASRALRSEYDTLTASLATYYKGKLAELKETDERQDITYLANKTGWDARAVALAALADRLAARTAAAGSDLRIDPPFFYALFRAGLPADEKTLFRTDIGTVEGIWKQAVEQGVIPAKLKKRIPQALKRFHELSARRLLEDPALIGASSFKELLQVSLGDDAEKQSRIAKLYARHAGDTGKFWQAVEKDFGTATATRLRLDSQLAYLTLNNAPLIQKLHAITDENGPPDGRTLVGLGLYRADGWLEMVGDVPVPPEIPGKSDDEKRARYGELLAAQLRLSFPTAVVAEMVGNAETPTSSPRQVRDFLIQHEGNFEIGIEPVARYVARNNLDVKPEVTAEITRLQRVYQITPDDVSMNGLLREGIDSAQAVVRHDRETFVNVFGEAVGGEQNARLIHAKAQQVHTAVLNIVLGYLNARTAPAIGVHSPSSIVDPAPAHADDVLAYGTLESLFGEMDYCTCEHCRSVLSPAAYLVDLLQFLYSDEERWNAFRDSWKTNHGGAPYPFDSLDAWNAYKDAHSGVTEDEVAKSPFDVLMQRRPDIQHLSLTCENTNTPLPYIDLVNETLEYYITNGLTLVGYTGHSTDGSVKPEDLLASPQFVSEAAYTALAEEHFPPPLPFHQPLENLRRYFRRFEAPLSEVMAALRKDDSLEGASENDYGWRDIWMETLGLSRAEQRLLTECWQSEGATDVMLTVKHLYGFDPATPDGDVRVVLGNAKNFCRRVGITYEELVLILRTGFVNPNAHLIPKLERLGVSFATLKKFKDGDLSEDEFEALLAPGLDPAQYGGDIKAWVRDDANYGRIMSLITLVDPENPENVCNFDQVELRYADPDMVSNRLRPFEFVRLIRFIRLWKKLGWSIEQTDKAVAALYPAEQAPDDADDAMNLERLDAGFLECLPRLGILRRVMERLELRPQRDLLPLLACFAPIDAYGESSLYWQMFLGLSQTDEAFAADGYGNVLTDGTAKLLDHTETLRAAFSLTAGEFEEIVAALSYNAETPLTLKNISAIFRRGWLARKLRLSVRELLLLVRFTDLDLFQEPGSVKALNPVDPGILGFMDFMDRLRALGVKPVQALYLVWNQDLSGKSTPPESEITTFARTLRDALAAIEAEFTVVDAPDGAITRERMALVYGNEATDLFFGLLGDTFVTTVPYDHHQATLEQSILEVAHGQIAYDDFRKQLSYKGVLDADTRDALKAVAGVPAEFQDAVDRLYAENQKVVGPFFARYPELRPLYEAYVSSEDPVEQKRMALLDALLPELKRRRKRQQALQLVAAAAETEMDLASALLEDAAVLHAVGDADRPALDDFTALETPGLTARFFFSDTVGETPDLTREAEPDLAYTASDDYSLPPNSDNSGAPISGVWSGYLEPPENSFYNLRIHADETATVTLELNGTPVTMEQNGGEWSNEDPIELRAGTLYAISLTVESVRNELALYWQTAGRGWEVIPARHLYPAALVERLRQTYVRFLKTAALATALELTAAEVVHFAAHADYRIGGEGWLNSLSVTGDPNDQTAAALYKVFKALLDFSRIESELSPGDERLLEVLKDPVATTADADSLLFVITRWEKPSLDALLDRFGKKVSDLARVETLRRVYEAFGWVKKLGISAATLISATTNEPTADQVSSLQAALRARYDEEAWREVLRPINDEMRSLQRDALVAYILHQMRSDPDSAHIDTPEKLFEYFLMDVQMDPCMLTSRIRHALSSVQLFIERCLMNLEQDVSPASIDAKQWEWMKRYRVWEANRKVYLWPENWLEPELRDDQSPFFKETMSELLQGDITEERAAQALVGYLTKLEEVAKLEVCGVHYEENEEGKADDVVHVIARTTGASRKYFYRRREYGYWTPWEKVNLDIEDNPVLPVIWRNRLFLFWLKLVKEAKPASNPAPNGNESLAEVRVSQVMPKEKPRVDIKAILNWSEYVDGKWLPSRTSDPAKTLHLDTVDTDLVERYLSGLRIISSVESEEENALKISISTQNNLKGYFLLYKSSSSSVVKIKENFLQSRTIFTSEAVPKMLFVIFHSPLTLHYVLRNNIAGRAVGPGHPPKGNPWDAPFFYEDARHVFYVTTEKELEPFIAWDKPGFGYDFGVPKLGADVEMPSLSVRAGKKTVSYPEAAISLPVHGTIDPTPFRHFVTENTFILTRIAMTGIVAFDGQDIGPAGRLERDSFASVGDN